MNISFITRLTLALATVVATSLVVSAQTTIFRDDFNRASLTTGAPTTYTSAVTAGDGGATISGQFLRLTNDATGGTNANGRAFVVGETSTFTGFTNLLRTNPAELSWSVNGKSNRTSEPGGFAGGTYGLAVVLGATSSDLTSASGYAIAYGNPGSPDPIRLVRFSGGLDADANLTTLISSGASDLAGVANYFSVKVSYNPSSEEWRLFVRDDGTSAWGDPSTTMVQVGSTLADATHTNTPLTHFGMAWNYSSAANQSAQFDNYTVTTLTSAPEPSSLALLLSSFLFLQRRRRQV